MRTHPSVAATESTRARYGHFGFWLMWALLVFLLSGTFFYLGARETVLEISSLGWSLIVGAATCLAVLLAVGLVWASRAGSIDVALADLRRNHFGAWLLRVSAMSFAGAVVAALFSWMWIQVVIRNIPASTESLSGEVVGFSRASTISRLCRFHVHVRLDRGQVEEICVERGVIHRSIPAPILMLKEHDSVVVTLRFNALGTSAAITGPAEVVEIQ